MLVIAHMQLNVCAMYKDINSVLIIYSIKKSRNILNMSKKWIEVTLCK